MIDTSSFQTLLVIVESIGLLAFAISGLIAGIKRNLDPVGICMVSGVTAFGGGTLRDILLDRRPLFWMEHSSWLWVVVLLSIFMILVVKKKHIELTERAIQIPDAFGLSISAVLGAQIAHAQGMDFVVCTFMGVITAVLGGVLRDIFCNQVPSAFRDHKPYAVLAFIGSGLYLFLLDTDLDPSISYLLAFLVTVILRIVSIFGNLELPKRNFS